MIWNWKIARFFIKMHVVVMALHICLKQCINLAVANFNIVVLKNNILKNVCFCSLRLCYSCCNIVVWFSYEFVTFYCACSHFWINFRVDFLLAMLFAKQRAYVKVMCLAAMRYLKSWWFHFKFWNVNCRKLFIIEIMF